MTGCSRKSLSIRSPRRMKQGPRKRLDRSRPDSVGPEYATLLSPLRERGESRQPRRTGRTGAGWTDETPVARISLSANFRRGRLLPGIVISASYCLRPNTRARISRPATVSYDPRAGVRVAFWGMGELASQLRQTPSGLTDRRSVRANGETMDRAQLQAFGDIQVERTVRS